MADNGKWPKALLRAFYDFMPPSQAPPRGGIIGPSVQMPTWIDHVATLPDSIEIARRAREDAEERAKTAEDKASRLVQVVLALLTITLALGSYQLAFALTHSPYWYLSLIPVLIAITSFALSAFEALQIDRVGMYSMPDGSELQGADSAQVAALVFKAEVHGRMLASWTADNKHTDLMQARAWMTRGLAALLIAAVLAGVVRAIPAPTPTPRQRHPVSSSTRAS